MYPLLHGMTVVEGSAFIAAPSCTLHLQQMGATAIRFDPLGGGPDSRRWPLAADGSSLYWEGLNKGKKSIALNLQAPEGRELAQRIATAGHGLFVTNFPERSFLAYDRLAALRADLICLRVMGWADGALAVDYTINAAVGVPLMTGPADDPAPVNHVLPAWDLMAGPTAPSPCWRRSGTERARDRGGRCGWRSPTSPPPASATWARWPRPWPRATGRAAATRCSAPSDGTSPPQTGRG